MSRPVNNFAIISILARRRGLPVVFALTLFAVASACSKSGPTKEQLLSRASDEAAAGQYAKAEADYREILRASPEDAQAAGRLGMLHYDQGQLMQAFPLLKRAAEARPNDADLQLKLGFAYLSLGGRKEARDVAMRVLDQQPGNEDAILLLADTAADAKDADEVEKLVEQVRAKDKEPNRPGYHLAFGELALRRNDQARAESEFEAAKRLAPDSSAVHFAWARLYLLRKDLQKANEAFKASYDAAPPRSLNRMRYVDFKLQTGGVSEAKTILEGIAAEAPGYLPARVRLMKIACSEHQESDCTTRVKGVLSQDPTNYDALIIDAALAAEKGEIPRALRELDYLSRLYPKDAEVRYQIALVNLLNSQDLSAVDTAIKNLNLAVGLNPNFDKAQLLLADLRMRKGEYTAAIDALKQLIKDRPQVAQAHLLLARAYLAQRDVPQALETYRHMAEVFPKNPEPPHLIGVVLAGQNRAEARAEFEKSLQIAPNYLPAVEQLVDLDIADKQYADALDRVQKILDKEPKFAPIWAIRGKIYMAQKDVPHAEADLLKAIELDPKLERAYLLLSQLYIASNRQEQAIEKLNAYVKENDKDTTTLMELGMLNDQLHHYDAARDAYEKLLAVNPKFVPALNNLAFIYLEHLGQLDKAYDLAKRGREAAPQEPHMADTLGWVLFKKGDYTRALPLLQESADKLSDLPDVQFHLGMAQYMLGDEAAARAALQKAAQAKDFPLKEEAARRLAVLAIEPGTADAAARNELETYLREKPDDPQALVRLAAFQEREGATDQATKSYEKIIDADPQFAPALRRLALLSAQHAKDDKKAVDLIQKARLAYPNDPQLTKYAGIVDYRLGNYSQAAEQLQQASAKINDDPELAFYIGMVHYELKQYAEAQADLERVQTMDLPSQLKEQAKRALEDPDLVQALGVLSYRAGDYTKAAERLQQVAAKRDRDPELLFYLGMSDYKLKKNSAARAELRRALDLNLAPALAEEAKRALTDCCKVVN
jgi:tetratricopeptide (TPR) repeat protein